MPDLDHAIVQYLFSLHAVTAPLAVYYGLNDWLANEKVTFVSILVFIYHFVSVSATSEFGIEFRDSALGPISRSYLLH